MCLSLLTIMEIIILLLVGVSSIVALFFLLFTTYSSKKNNNATSHPKLPPGKLGLPLLGETLQFMWAGRRGEPERFVLDRMAKYDPRVFKTSLLGEPTAIPCGVAGNKFTFTNEDKLFVSWWPRSVDLIFPTTRRTSSNEETKRLRSLLSQFLKPEALQRYIGIMDMILKRQIALECEGKEVVTIYPLAKLASFSVACRVFLSMDDLDTVARFQEPFEALAEGIVSVPVNLPGTRLNRAIKAAQLVRRELRTMIDQRKRDLAEKMTCSPDAAFEDVLSHMLVTADNGKYMSEADIADKMLALLFGGHQTTSVAITFVVKYLAELPHVYDAVYQEQMEITRSKAVGEPMNWDDVQKMKYSWNVACEALRLAPPVAGAFRVALQDFTYAGFHIPKGWKLYWSAYSTHKNPDYFPEPDKFDPSRFEGRGPAPYSYIPFGGGPRMCPGMEFARLEILLFIHNFVTSFKWEKLLPYEKITFDPIPLPANGLPIRLYPHHLQA